MLGTRVVFIPQFLNDSILVIIFVLLHSTSNKQNKTMSMRAFSKKKKKLFPAVSFEVATEMKHAKHGTHAPKFHSEAPANNSASFHSGPRLPSNAKNVTVSMACHLASPISLFDYILKISQ
jgi:hypothetical protein